MLHKRRFAQQDEVGRFSAYELTGPGKKIKGKKRHILVDTVGLVLHAIVHPADIQERDGGILLISTLFGRFPFLRKMFADGGYQGPRFEQAIARIFPQLDVEIVKRSDTVGGFKVLPRPPPSQGQALGRRADVCLAQPLPPSVQGFRESDPKRSGFSPPRIDPAHATKAL